VNEKLKIRWVFSAVCRKLVHRRQSTCVCLSGQFVKNSTTLTLIGYTGDMTIPSDGWGLPCWNERGPADVGQ
jgi:hypothetical protein